ncbi:protein HIDE1 [Tiliqua scincoides]|uniref:protein HIDE1 n=1 Tax=Tiliqua scincoides TaxID=71010 RepID=UPI003461B96A
MPVYKSFKMFHSNMDLKILFLLAGSLVVSSLFPAPLVHQDIHVEGNAIKIICMAPRNYVDTWFDLLKEGQDQVVQSLAAAETQHQVTFLLERTSTRDGDQYRCRYRLYNGSQLQMSELSHILLIVMEASDSTTSPPIDSPGSDSKGSTWVLPTALSVTGVLLLVVIVVVLVIVIQRFKDRRKKKRELKSCWTASSHPQTETSFDNCMFTVTMRTDQVVDDWITSATGTRPTSGSSLKKPDFCTFRAPE